jgi:hypothetical protein
LTVEHGENDSDAKQLAHSPAAVDVRRQVTTKSNGADFRGVGDGDCLEDAPGDAAENLGSEKRLDILGHEEESDETREPDQAGE